MSKYQIFGIDQLSYFLGKIRSIFADINHTHTKSEITDFPNIVTWNNIKTQEDFSNLNIVDNSVIYFSSGEYSIDSWYIENLKNITIILNEAVISCSGDYFLKAKNCDDIKIYGGKITGSNLYSISVEDCKRAKIENCEVLNVGGTNSDAPSGIRIFGDCSGFIIKDCCVHDISSQYVSSDGFIHSYGIFVNRLNSNNNFSKIGKISNCYIYNVAGIDTDSVKADGDGIFIQGPPYLDDDSNVVWREPKIIIENCIINDCKKRGIKVSVDGVEILNSLLSGEFWYAAIDLQYGHSKVSNCNIYNSSSYTNSVTSGIVSSDGDIEIFDCTIRCPYTDSDNNTSYHPGIRLDKRLDASVIEQSVPWGTCFIKNCYFDKVSLAVFAGTSVSDAPTYTLYGIEIENCRFGTSNQNHVVDILSTVFPSIGTFRFIDFRFDSGSNRTEIKSVNSNFTYPIGIDADPTICFELYSKYWTAEPMSGYNGLPTSPHTKIIYAGDISGIKYKEYNNYGSSTYGTKSPSAITATLAKQLLYNSKVGDKYVNITSGTVYICTTAGTSSDIGIWTDISSSSEQTYTDGNEVAY